MIINEEDKKIIIACLAVMLLSAAGLWFFNAGGNDVSDIRRGAQSVTEQLDRAESGQQEEAESLDRAAEAASNSQRAVGEIQKIERRDADLISGSEEILQRVRERGGTENQN